MKIIGFVGLLLFFSLGVITHWLVFVSEVGSGGSDQVTSEAPECNASFVQALQDKLITEETAKSKKAEKEKRNKERKLLKASKLVSNETLDPLSSKFCPCDPPLVDQQAIQKDATESRGAAVQCVDELMNKRMGKPLTTQVLARCALAWITKRWEQLVDASKPKFVFDYGYDLMGYALIDKLPPEWLFVTALLLQDSVDFPRMRGMPRNQVQLSPPILHRLLSWFATHTMADFQMALRIDEMLNYAIPIDIWKLVSNIISKGRVTFLLLPCTGFSDMIEEDIVYKAIAKQTRNRKELGIHYMNVSVERLQAFSYGGCTRNLLKVTLLQLHKGVRPKWCYYPDQWSYNLWYSHPGPLLAARHDKSMVVREITEIAEGARASLADVLGWGVTRVQRESWVFELLGLQPQADPRPHRWIIGEGALLKYDTTPLHLLDGPQPPAPVGGHYLEYLRLALCSGNEQKSGNRWKQYRNTTGGLEWRTMKQQDYKFVNGKMYHRYGFGESFKEVKSSDRQHAEIGKCAICNECKNALSAYDERPKPAFLKMAVPSSCTQCSTCVRTMNFAYGTPIWEVYYGCLDMEGVTDNGDNTKPEMCDDSQMGPVPRPSDTNPVAVK